MGEETLTYDPVERIRDYKFGWSVKRDAFIMFSDR